MKIGPLATLITPSPTDTFKSYREGRVFAKRIGACYCRRLYKIILLYQKYYIANFRSNLPRMPSVKLQ
jgi:hypothetical protein